MKEGVEYGVEMKKRMPQELLKGIILDLPHGRPPAESDSATPGFII